MSRRREPFLILALVLASMAACSNGAEPSDAGPDVGEQTDGGEDVGPADADAFAVEADVDVGGDAEGDSSVGLPVIEPCGQARPESLVSCADRARYAADLTLIAEPRPPGSSHWQAIQDLCGSRLGELGYEVELQSYGTGVNVIGRMGGASTPEELVVLMAHYDHVEGCEGADDNASGVAALLEIARVLSTVQLGKTVELVCSDEEELGLIGAAAYADEALGAGKEIEIVYVLDSIAVASDEPGSQQMPVGFDLLFPELTEELVDNEFRASFFVTLADDLAPEAVALISSFGDALGRWNGVMMLEEPFRNDPLLSDLRRAEHATFWDRGVPALLVNDTTELRYPCYHCLGCTDTVSRLDIDFALDAVKATLGSAATVIGVSEL